MRTIHNLTRDSDLNDPIDYLIKGFSFYNFKDDSWHSRGKFSLFFPRNLPFNHSVDTEMSLEEEEVRDSRIMVSIKFDYLKTSKNTFFIEEHSYK